MINTFNISVKFEIMGYEQLIKFFTSQNFNSSLKEIIDYIVNF
jgi:hypothetical protein